MRKARGYSIITDPYHCEEVDTYTCCHCQQVIDKPPFRSATDDDRNGKPIGAWCTCCDAAMCPRCIGKGCRPIERWLIQQETRRNYDEHMG